MTCSGYWRAVAVGLAMLVLQGCATIQQERESGFALLGSALFPEESPHLSVSPGTSPSADEWKARTGARQAEVEWALSQMWGVASSEEQVGARLEFTFWAEHGALTLLSWQRAVSGGKAGQPADGNAFAEGLRRMLALLAERRTGALALSLHRERSRWRVDYEAATVNEPSEARKWPAQRTGYPAGTLSTIHTLAKQVARLLQVPAGASARLSVDVSLEDDRIIGWEPGSYQATGGGTMRPAASQAADIVTLALLPFTRGLGPRTVRLELTGTHEGASAPPHWRVERAGTLRPQPPDEAVEDVLREYRLLHAEIFRRYREEMVDTVVLAGTFSLEQLALGVVGGLVGKGLHVAFEAVAPRMMRVFARGGAEAVRWFRTQLVRAGRKDQELLRRLLTKMETEGFESLSTAERMELTQLLQRMEQVLTAKVDNDARIALRAKARQDFYALFHPELEDILRDAKGKRYDIHHLIPLEYAHLFPEMDINAAVNLTAVGNPVHTGINKAWNTFRTALGDTASPEQVRQMAAITQRHFERWYNKVYDPRQSAPVLERATAAALDDVQALVSALQR